MLAKVETLEPAPYRSVRHALRSAMAHEAYSICGSPSFERTSRGYGSLTPWDRAAQSAIVIRLLHENCREHVIAAATAQFMPTAEPAAPETDDSNVHLAGMVNGVATQTTQSIQDSQRRCDCAA